MQVPIFLFAIFIYFSLVIFKYDDPEEVKEPSQKKSIRKRVYTICGIIMLIAILLVGVTFKFIEKPIRVQYNIIFWLELLALWAFGFSWLTKSNVFWSDDNKTNNV